MVQLGLRSMRLFQISDVVHVSALNIMRTWLSDTLPTTYTSQEVGIGPRRNNEHVEKEISE